MANVRMCPNCRALLDPKATRCDYCETDIGKRAYTRERTSALSKAIPQENFTTIVILIVNFGVFAATLILTMKGAEGSGGFLTGIDSRVLRVFGGKDGFLIAHGEWWRLVTAGFLHAGIFHILMNSWVLFDLGMNAEEVFGTARFLVIYFVSSVFGFIASLYWSPFALSVGASAAACGLIGAMIAHGYRSRNPFASSYIRWAVLIVVIGLMPGFHIDNAAHLGGMAAGFVIAYLGGTPRLGHPVESVWKVVAALLVGVVGWSFYLAYTSLAATPFL